MVSTHIIGLSGKKQSGKNTACSCLFKCIESHFGNRSCKMYSFADVLKEKVCIDTLGLTNDQCYGTDDQKNSPTLYKWDTLPLDIKYKNRTGERRAANGEVYEFIYPQGYMTAREIMQIVGTDIFRNFFDNDIWVNATFRNIKKEGYKFALISDVRFPGEIEGILNEKGTVIRLLRDVCGKDSHASETALDNFDFNRKNCIILDNKDMNIKSQDDAIISMFKEKILM